MNAPLNPPVAIGVYQAINKVQADLAAVGISKDRTNTQGSGYKFRGIDDVYNVLSRLLATHNLCILPRMIARTCDERQSKSGGALFYVTVEAEFDFVSAMDGSTHTVRTFGEAMDSGDKATNKAMSAAYKYAAFQAFAIPTQGDNDADTQTHEVKSKIDVPKQARLPKLTDAEAEYEYTKWIQVKSLLVDEDGDPDQARIVDEWGKLPSNVRSAVKAIGEAMKAEESAKKKAALEAAKTTNLAEAM